MIEYSFIRRAIEVALRDNILYGIELPPMSVVGSFVNLLLEELEVSFYFNNGKIDEVYLEGRPVELSTEQKYNITLDLWI